MATAILRPSAKSALHGRRLPLLCFTLLVALVVFNLLHAGLARQDKLMIGAPGALLFAAGFDGFLDDWSLYEGTQRATIVNGELELAVNAAQTAAWSTAQYNFGDFDMQVRARAVAGPVDNGLGIVFRLNDARGDGCELPAIVLCGLEALLPLAGAALRQTLVAAPADRYYAFLISSDGFYSLWQAEAGSARLRSAWIASPHIRQGLDAENVIRVVGAGGTFRFMINGAPAVLCLPDAADGASTYYAGECLGGAMSDKFVDDSLSSGALGVIVQSTASGGGGVVARFDRALVYAPGERSEDASL
ncbi:MAG: hypothetical protein OXE95_03405 [Chloroflexi bacterium]|nr:hypothetical protein [Chloroflexota bacterium]